MPVTKTRPTQAAQSTDVAGAGSASPYRDVVARVRRVLSLAEIGQVTGVTERSVQHWSQGARLAGASRDRLMDLHYVIDELSDVYTDEGIEVWLHTRQRALRARTPVQVLAEGDVEAVLALVERLAGGPRE